MRSVVYRTFVLLAYEWAEEREVVVDLVEELLRTSRLKGTLAWDRGAGGEGSQTVRPGRFGPTVRDLITAPDLRYLTLVAMKPLRPEVLQLWLAFEADRFDPSPPYLRYLEPEAPAESRDRGGVKLLTFSVQSDLYRRRFCGSRERNLIGTVERAFVDLGAVCGYDTVTQGNIPGAFSDRPGASSAWQRFIDFDYRSSIDGVYRYNLLSVEHWNRARNAVGQLAAEGTVDVRTLPAPDGTVRGVALEVTEWNERRAAEIVARLRALAPPPRTERRTFFLLMNEEQVALAGGVDRLRSYRMVEELKTLRGGISEIREGEVRTAEDARRRFMDLQEIFGPLYRRHGQAGRLVHEDLVAYPGFSDATLVYQRVPRVEVESHGYAQLFVEDRETPESSEIHFLIVSDAGTHALKQLQDTLAEWYTTILEDPSTWGLLGLGETTVNHVSEGWSHVSSVADMSRLRQEGIHLLMFMLDEMNARSCCVRYVVIGQPRRRSLK